MLKKLAICVGVVFALGAVDGKAAELYGTLKKIKESGVINMGHRAGLGLTGPDQLGLTRNLCPLVT